MCTSTHMYTQHIYHAHTHITANALEIKKKVTGKSLLCTAFQKFWTSWYLCMIHFVIIHVTIKCYLVCKVLNTVMESIHFSWVFYLLCWVFVDYSITN